MEETDMALDSDLYLGLDGAFIIFVDLFDVDVDKIRYIFEFPFRIAVRFVDYKYSSKNKRAYDNNI